jgi:hypothetical protein
VDSLLLLLLLLLLFCLHNVAKYNKLLLWLYPEEKSDVVGHTRAVGSRVVVQLLLSNYRRRLLQSLGLVVV